MLRLFVVLVAVMVTSCSPSDRRNAIPEAPRTLTSFDISSSDEQPVAAHSVKFTNAPLDQVLDLYAQTSKRTIIRGANLPDVKFTFSNELPMTKVKLLQALDTLLAAQKITAIPQGADYMKIVAEKDAPSETPPIFSDAPERLPDSSSYVIYVLHVKADQSLIVALTPFSRSPNSIIYVPGDRPSALSKKVPALNAVESALGPQRGTLLILRDYSSNVRSMLQVVRKLQGGNQ